MPCSPALPIASVEPISSSVACSSSERDCVRYSRIAQQVDLDTPHVRSRGDRRILLDGNPCAGPSFSPQVGRATAMGFWTAGPVLGSLLVSVVASHTIGLNPSPGAWAHQFRIAGIIGLGAGVIALFWMHELRPGIRDQVMVDLSDQALVEVRAEQIDTDAAVRHQWRQLLKVDVLVPALGYSIFLVYYVTAIGFGLIFFTTVLGFSIQGANSLNNWAWGFDAIAVVLVGFLSDRIRVRKPLILLGATATAVLILVYSRHARPNVPYHNAAIAARGHRILRWDLGDALDGGLYRDG